MTRKWLDRRSVIPAKAGIQPALLWIPAFAGKTVAGMDVEQEGMAPGVMRRKVANLYDYLTGAWSPPR